MAEVRVKGLDELQKLLDELPAKIEKNVVRGGLRAGAKVVMEEAQRACPVGTGALPEGEPPNALRDSIRISMRSAQGKVLATVKAGNKTAYYAHFVEFGTARHWIKPKNRKSLFLAGLMRELIDHPGAQKKPFMRPAIDNKAEEAIEAMAEYCRERIPKELGKLK